MEHHMYSASDFMTDICDTARDHLGARIPDGEDNASECADVVAAAIVRAQVERRELLGELQETLRDLREWDGTDEAMEIIRDNISAAIAKATEHRPG
jgi:hypothetical protein